MELNIYDKTPRRVVCLRSQTLSGKMKIKAGEVYHLTTLNAFNWYTNVYLKEFPGYPLNSVSFGEIDGYVQPD